MKLSVLITTYNLEKYIQETIDSVLAQKVNFDYEIIVGDDGSSDNTQKIVESYIKKYPDTIRMNVMDRDPNVKYNRIERASKNRIALINIAKGDYLIFLDGDDIYNDVNKLQKQMDILESDEHKDCVACGHNMWKYWSEDNKELMAPYSKEFKVSGRQYWRDTLYFSSDTLVFRNVFKNGVPEKIHPAYFDDNMIIFCLLEYGNLYYLPEAMVNYRQVGNSSWNSVDELEKNIINLIDWNVEYLINSSYEKESTIRHMYNLIYIWRNAKDIPSDMRDKYAEQMSRDHLDRAREWVFFDEQPVGKKFSMTLWLVPNLISFVFNKVRKMLNNKYS